MGLRHQNEADHRGARTVASGSLHLDEHGVHFIPSLLGSTHTSSGSRSVSVAQRAGVHVAFRSVQPLISLPHVNGLMGPWGEHVYPARLSRVSACWEPVEGFCDEEWMSATHAASTRGAFRHVAEECNGVSSRQAVRAVIADHIGSHLSGHYSIACGMIRSRSLNE